MSKSWREFARGFDGCFRSCLYMCVQSYEFDCFFGSGGNLVFKGSYSVPESQALLGSIFRAGMREFFGIRLFPPRSLGDFQPDGIRLRNTVADLSEAPPRAQ